MGILIGLGVLWLVTELIHKNKNDEEKMNLSVIQALRKMDMSTILFFLGILLAVSSLETAGILSKLAVWCVFQVSYNTDDCDRLSFGIYRKCSPCCRINGNVPSFSLSNRPLFLGAHSLIHGTGGSILIIGSAEGVAVMGISKIEFFKYLKKISGWPFLDCFRDISFYFVQSMMFSCAAMLFVKTKMIIQSLAIAGSCKKLCFRSHL